MKAWDEFYAAVDALVVEIRKPFVWLLDRLTWLTR